MPDNVIQFRQLQVSAEEERLNRMAYRGECGDGQGYWPKRHRWGPWEYYTVKATGARFRERMCKNCALMSDRDWLGEPK